MNKRSGKVVLFLLAHVIWPTFDSLPTTNVYKGLTLRNGKLEIRTQRLGITTIMPSSRLFASPLASPKFSSVSYLLESRAQDIVQRLTCRRAQPEEIALEVVLAGASSITNATRHADILGIVNSGFFKTVLGDIGDTFRSEVMLYIGKIFEYFWTVSYFEFLGDHSHPNQLF